MAAAHTTIRVHGAEVGTDGDTVNAYAEAIALVVAALAVAAAVWVAAMPAENAADLTWPAPPTPATAPFPAVPGGEAVQPNLAGPATTSAVEPARAFGFAALIR